MHLFFRNNLLIYYIIIVIYFKNRNPNLEQWDASECKLNGMYIRNINMIYMKAEFLYNFIGYNLYIFISHVYQWH